MMLDFGDRGSGRGGDGSGVVEGKEATRRWGLRGASKVASGPVKTWPSAQVYFLP